MPSVMVTGFRILDSLEDVGYLLTLFQNKSGNQYSTYRAGQLCQGAHVRIFIIILINDYSNGGNTLNSTCPECFMLLSTIKSWTVPSLPWNMSVSVEGELLHCKAQSEIPKTQPLLSDYDENIIINTIFLHTGPLMLLRKHAVAPDILPGGK